MRRLFASTFVLATVTSVSAGCNDDAAEDEACAPGPYFSRLPVPLESIASVKPLGEVDPPDDILPNGQTGFTLNGTQVPVVAPGPIRVRTIERSTWLESPFRQGESDYGVHFTIAGCKPIYGVFGHLTTLAPELEKLVNEGDCDQRRHVDEEIVSCRTHVDVRLEAGAAVGTAGGPTAIGLDFDLFDSRTKAKYIADHRYIDNSLHGICMQPLFEEPLATQLLERVSHHGVKRTAEPRCGTLEVDIEGTAQGMWMSVGEDVPYRPDTFERFLVLAPHAILPDTLQSLGSGARALAPDNLHVFPRERQGRVNRSFSDLMPDGTIYCYQPTVQDVAPAYPGVAEHSFFIALETNGQLGIERVVHAEGASPCAQDPGTWRFGAGALSYMR